MLSTPWTIFSLKAFVVAQAAGVPGIREEVSRITEDGAAASDYISSQLNSLWSDVLGGGLYAAIARLGVFFAIGTLIIFMVQWFKALVDGDNPQAFSDIIWPLLVIFLLANNGQVLANCTLQLRNIINSVNQTILTSTTGSLQLQEAYQQVQGNMGAEATLRGLEAQCASIADPAQQNECIQNAGRQAQEIANSSSNPFLGIGRQVRQFFSTNIFQLSVRGWLIAFGIAFQWIVEISMLLTGLLGPLAVGGSLLPVGQKAILAWLTGFFSVGMVKLSFNIICGLVATLIVNAESSDPLIFAFATGLLAPILSIVIASGGGWAVFSSLSSMLRFGVSAALQVWIGKMKL